MNVYASMLGVVAAALSWCQVYPCLRTNVPTEARQAFDRIIEDTRAGKSMLACWVGREDPHLLYCDWNDLRTPLQNHDALMVVQVRHVNGWILDTVTMYWKDSKGGALKIWDSVGDDPARVADTFICIDICAYVALADATLYAYVCDERERSQLLQEVLKDKFI